MAKISLEVPDPLHFKLKRKQLELEACGQKVNLKDLYLALIQKVIEHDPTLQMLSKKKDK